MVLNCTGAYACGEVWVVVIRWSERSVNRGVGRFLDFVVPDTAPQVPFHTSSHGFGITLQTER